MKPINPTNTVQKDAVKNISVDKKYYTFFENAPISLWIEDFSALKKTLNTLVRESGTDIQTYIANNPDTLAKLAFLITVKDVNNAAVKLYNAKSKEDLLDNLPKVFTENSNAGFTKLLVAILLGEKETEIESVNKTLDGQEINTLVKFKVIDGSEDTLENVIVSVENITERVLNEQKFNTAKNFLSNTLLSIKDGLVMLDRDAKYTYVNKKAADFFGKSAQELIGENIWTEFPEKIGDLFYDSYQKAVTTGKPISFENYFKPWDKWLENRIIPSHDGVLMFFHETTDKRETENRIKAAYNIINKSSSIAFLCKNEWDFPVEFASENAINLFGYSHTELIKGAVKLYQLIFPEDLKWVSETFLKLFKIEKSNEFRFQPLRILTKNGEVKWVQANMDVVKNSANEITHIQGICEDITDHIHSKKLLEKSERKYRDLFEKSIDAILILNNGFIVDCNKAAINMFGFDRKILLGFRPSQLSTEMQFDGISSIEKSEKMIQIALEKGSNRFRWNHQNKNAHVFPTEVTLTRVNENEEGLTIHAVVTDITEKVKKEALENVLYNISKAALTTGEFKEFSLFVRNELQEIIDTSNFYIAIYNEETDMITTPVFVDDIEDVEEFSAKNSLTGYVIKSKKPLMLTKNAHKALIKNKVVELIGGHAEIWVGVPLLIQEKCIGAIVVQSYENENAYNENDVQLLEFVADQISTTIQRKKVENELNSALLQAQESDRLKSAFLANMSHEIRTPMNGIIGFSELCLDPNITKEKQKEYANIVIKSSKRLLSIVNDILDISKIEAGAVTLNLENVNLNKMLDELEVFFKPIAQESNLILTSERGLENFKSAIETDKTKLNQVLTNLLSNAFKFTDTGGVTFGYQLIENNLQFYVKDTGIGVDKDLHHIIFDRFSQGNLNISKQHKGTGLGLAITKRIIELFNGEIWLNSDQSGTTIYFTIPYVKSKIPLISSVIEEQKPTIDVKNKEITILVAEDEEYNMMYITELFSTTNFKVIEANNGKKALELAQSNPEIQLVLMDIKMPVMDGNEAMKEIKKLRPSLPVIALSAFAMESDKERALGLGFDAYLTKPLDRKLLFQLIDKFSKKLD